jgi:hypothetical protein
MAKGGIYGANPYQSKDVPGCMASRNGVPMGLSRLRASKHLAESSPAANPHGLRRTEPIRGKRGAEPKSRYPCVISNVRL